MRKLTLAVACLWLGVLAGRGYALTRSTWQVFTVPSNDENAIGQDVLTFIQLYTGETTQVPVYGTSYTVVGPQIMFFDRLNNRVALAGPDGVVTPHPFIQPGPNTRRLDWVVSRDQRLIAWTLTEGTPESLITTTTVANIDGTEPNQVLVDGPRNGIRAVPVAFSVDDSLLYMDYQPEGLGDFTPYSEYAGLFEVSLKSRGVVDYLPGEPGCFCGAGFGGGYFLRLGLTADLSGFDLRVVNLPTEVETVLGAVPLQNYTQGGDVLVSADGTQAVYALAQVENFGTPEQTIRTVFVLVDLTTMTQRELTAPLTNFVRPVAWTEGNQTIIFTSPVETGTWKIDIDDGRLQKVAEATYLGTIAE